jgi:hypothetical protein
MDDIVEACSLPPGPASGTLRGVGRERDPGERASWVQTNTEFHQDWTVQENQGHHVKWKSGLSLEAEAKEKRRKYAPQVAPRRPRRRLFWVVIWSLAIGAGYAFLRGL